MEPNSLMWVGSPCGSHGPYIFYKAFRFHLHSKPRILSLGDFFFVRCKPGDSICVAELQLLWEERTTKQLLSSSKLYFLPEDTPQGRTVTHGEDELIAVSEKVVVRLEDLVKWTEWDSSGWTKGLKAVPLKPSTVLREQGKNGQREPHLLRYRESTLNSGLNFKDVVKEKAELGEGGDQKRAVVLSYPQYCRYRSVLARLRERPPSLLTQQVVLALGGIASLTSNTHILYCRDTFEHPTLLDNESVCDEFAPNLKGRPRKKKPSVSQRRESLGQGTVVGKEAGSTEGKASVKVKPDSKTAAPAKSRAGSSSSSSSSSKRGSSSEEKNQALEGGSGDECRAEEQAFLVALYKYMKERKTPIERIPYLGFKQINLWTMFQAAQKLGGYELITARRQWKQVYDELGGNPGSTSAATCTRRHYERLILPYERFTKGEEDKPLPPAKPRKLEAGPQEGGVAKTKAGSTVKRPKEEQSQKPKGDKDAAAIVLEPSVSDSEDSEKSQEEESQVKTEPQIASPSLQASGEGRASGDEDEELHLTVKEEVTHDGCGQEKDVQCHSAPWDSDSHQPALSIPEDDDVFPVVTPEPVDHSHPAKDLLQREQAELGGSCTQGKGDQAGLEDQCHVGMVLPTLKQRPHQPSTVSAPEPPSERAELPPREDSCSSYSPHLYPHRANPGIMSPLAKKKLLSQVSGSGLPNHNHYASYGPPPPLISKALANGSTEEPAGQPAMGSAADVGLIHRPSVIQHAQSSKPRGGEERREGLQRDTVAAGETYPCSDLPKHHPHPYPHPQPQPHPYPYPHPQAQSQPHSHHHLHHPSAEPYLLREEEDRAPEMPRPGQTPSFLSDFYSSPHLHSLYRQTEHHLTQGQAQGHGERERLGELGRYREACLPRECETTPGFPPTSQPHPDSTSAAVSIGYGARMSQQDKMVPSSNGEKTTATSEDQPTDLSLPKLSPHKHSRAHSHTHTVPHHHHPHQHPTMHQEVKAPLLFQTSSPQGSGGEYHPRACRVPPMTMTPPTHTPRQALAVDPNPRTSERASNGRGGGRGGEDASLGGGYKVDVLRGSSRSPILNAKVSPHNVCTARPLKRTLEELENHAPERKIRAVTPMHSSSSSSYSSAIPKDVPSTPTPPLRKARSPELDSDLMVLKPGEPMHTHANVHISGFLDGHKFPLHSAPIFPGLYPGAFVSHVQDMCDGLGSPLPHGYPPHPLQYLKNQAVLSPIVPPFAIHSFMMQRQLLAQAATSPAHMYRHPMGASYGELLHHGLYPMSALAPQPAFNPPQLSSVHPSTKLS
ncbi:AT-rich interactive domain-containing protein 5B isoform X2 [Hypomesus transpacificus]|uniref:AT-rich interactive domain-containing protein 5B isoform X2 n=1 Tax=Hypomesus transpacificus TaxID=137520 RepID=UPI001F0855D6|nr:AT-rich interactive domain-containing protein 5B isoform X2 [Hypomesus transpacificus]